MSLDISIMDIVIVVTILFVFFILLNLLGNADASIFMLHHKINDLDLRIEQLEKEK